MSVIYYRCLSLALASVVALPLTPAIAQQDRSTKSQQQSENKQEKKQGNKQANKQSADTVLKSLEHLDLKDDQEKEIRQIVKKHDQKLNQAWRQFSQVHMQAVAMEAAMYAAMEDGMDDQQRNQFRKQRDRRDQSSQNANNARSNSADREQSQQKDKSQKSDETKVKRASDSTTDRARSQTANRADYQSKQQSNSKDSNQEQSASKSKSSGEHYVTTMIIIPVQQQYASSGLDERQKARCDEACKQFQSKLVNTWDKIHKHHNELVKLEAEKLSAIEEVLNEQQRKQLRNQSGNNQSTGSDSQSS